jgi:L-ascorbate metabolism protein UlaG (beta-lactamase superfamily)
MHLTHLGHACLLVEVAGARVLIDPGAFSSGFEELTGLDAIVITHQHADHVDVQRLPALLEANDGVLLLAEAEAAAELEHAGIDATPLHAGDETTLGGLPLRAVGGTHAVIHPDVPLVGNVGLLLGTPLVDGGEGVLFHPGDSYDTTPQGVDVLALPLVAPWAKLAETVEFLRAVAPGVAVPVHDALLTPPARGIYVSLSTALAPEGTAVLDLAGAGRTDPLAEGPAPAQTK